MVKFPTVDRNKYIIFKHQLRLYSTILSTQVLIIVILIFKYEHNFIYIYFIYLCNVFFLIGLQFKSKV